MDYHGLLVHSLWGQLWIGNFFRPQMPVDLRKRGCPPVEEKEFPATFIHSLQLLSGDSSRPTGHNARRICEFCDAYHRITPGLTIMRPPCMHTREYAVDNCNLA